MSETNTLPVVDAITEWTLSKVGKTFESSIKLLREKIVDELPGFVRFGNRTDYNRDELAFASAKMEPSKEYPGKYIFNFSNMDGRIPADIIRELLWFYSEAIVPPTERKDGKLQHHKKAREKWLESLGFNKRTVGKGSRFIWEQDADHLSDRIAQLIPVRLDGTTKAKSTKFQMALNAPADLGARTFNLSCYLPDPKVATQHSGVMDDVKYLLVLMERGWTPKNPENEPVQQYLLLAQQLVEAQPEAAEAAA